VLNKNLHVAFQNSIFFSFYNCKIKYTQGRTGYWLSGYMHLLWWFTAVESSTDGM